jgi:hypothetical protein
LVGSDSTTDTIKFANGTNVTVTRTDADTITIASTDTNTTYTVDATATTGGANLNLTGSDSSTDSVAYVGSGATTVTRTDANTITISSTDNNTTYTQNFSSTTGGTNLNLVGSDSTTDTVKFANGTGVTVSYTDADTATIAIGQSVGTGDNPTFAGATLGAVTVGVDSDQTISTSSGNLILQTATGTNAGTMTLTAGANGAITLAPNGTGNAAFTFNNGGNLINTRNYVFGAIRNSTTASIGDIWALNSSSTTTPTRGISIDNSADTAKTASYLARSYGAVAGSRSRFIFERARGTAASPSAVQNGDFLGEIDVTGYTSTGWLNDTVSAVPGFFGFVATENWVSNTNLGTSFALNLAPTATTITAGTSNIPTINSSPQLNYFRADRFSMGQGKTSQFSATGCSTSGTTLTIGTLSSGTIAIGQTLTFTNASAIGVYISANISGSGSGSTWTISESVGTLSSQVVSGQTGFIAGATAATTVDALQNLRLLKNNILSSGGTTQIVTSSAGATLELRGDNIQLENAAGTSIVGSGITYNRVYGAFQYNTTVTPVAANTAYVFPIGTVDFSNIVTVGSTSRIILGAAGIYNLQFSVQVANADNQEHVAYVWLRKNGTDVTASMGRITVIKSGSLIAGWNYYIDSANTTDYYEIAYAVSDTSVTFPTYAATAFGPSTASLITTISPVGA